MGRKLIDAILWRKYLAATSHAIWEVSPSQYYFELPDRGYEKFLGRGARTFIDKDGNQAFTITLEAFDGHPIVGPHDVTFTKKRATASREGKWTVDSIRDGSKDAYDLWRRNRGPIAQYHLLPPDEKDKNFIVIVRDLDQQFHGRWITGSDFDALPDDIQQALSSEKAGWKIL